MSKVTSVRVRLGPAFERQRPSLFLFTTFVLQSSVFDVGLRTSDLGPLFKWRRAGHWDRNHPEGELASPLPKPRRFSTGPTCPLSSSDFSMLPQKINVRPRRASR